MAYNNRTQFPKTYVQLADVVATAQTIFTKQAGKSDAISHIVISNASAGLKTAVFRATDDSPEVVRVILLAGTSIVIPGWRTDVGEGLEVVDTSATAAVTGMYVTVFYVT